MMSALLSRCLVLVLGTLYPAYRSYKAIKNKDVREHVKWMMYWIVFALFTTLETFLDIFVSWFPFYYEIKILFILWVLSPATRGSSLLYKKVVHPMLISREKDIDELIEKTKQQGYTTFLQLFTSGFQYASNLFVHSAIKGQSLLGTQLKKSLSMNDVYDGNDQPNINGNKPPVDTINEDDEDDEFDLNDKVTRQSKMTSYEPLKTTRKYSHNALYSRDFEIIDDDEIDSNKKPISKRRASSKQLGSTTTSSYKSTEPSHYGTITRGKTTKTTKITASVVNAQSIYDHDL